MVTYALQFKDTGSLSVLFFGRYNTIKGKILESNKILCNDMEYKRAGELTKTLQIR